MIDLDDVMSAAPVMAVVTIEDADDATPLAEALCRGGIPLIEITLRTPAALEAIRRVRAAAPQAVLGAGTILTIDDLRAAAAAGAAFGVSPGATPALLAAAAAGPIPFLPGVATASEVMAGLEAGYRRFKLFPAEAAGGLALLKSFAGPLPQARFCPTGGLTLETAPSYLALPNVGCVGASWLAPPDLVRARDWGAIEARARAARALRP